MRGARTYPGVCGGLGRGPVWGMALCLAAATAWAFEPGPAPVVPARPAASTNHAAAAAVDMQRVQTQADSVQYDRNTGWITAQGHVLVRKGMDELRADLVRVNLASEEAHARGNVVLARPGGLWRGAQATYNFKTREILTDQGNAEMGPLKWRADRVERTSNEFIWLHRGEVTTCSNGWESTHYHVRARRVKVVPNRYMVARGAVWYFGGVPVLYLPWWWSELSPDWGLRFRPGHDTEWGTFLLSSCWYKIVPGLKGETHVDYRTRRGVALGQDFRWADKARDYDGGIAVYGLNDARPMDDDDTAAGRSIPGGRYRVRLYDSRSLSDADSVFLRANYLSDPDMLDDFFRGEYRRGSSPENYAMYGHRGSSYMAGVLAQARLNTFFDSVDRLPELSLDMTRQQIGTSPFYYESQSTAAFLQRRWADASDAPDGYSVFRADTAHRVYRPARYWGFLNLVPRVGVRETYYSATRSVVQEESLVWTTNSVAGVTNRLQQTVTNEVVVEAAGGVRSAVELGLEASYKAFATWGGDVRPRRHIVQPYANYTLIPEPSMRPEELYAFDSVDELDLQHEILLGVRNKYQTKWDGQPHDLVDVNLYTVFYIHRDPGQGAVPRYYVDAEFLPAHKLRIRTDAEYDTDNPGLDKWNLHVQYETEDLLKMDLEYRFLRDDSRVLGADLTLLEKHPWEFNVYGRYEFDTARVEEYGGYLQRNYDCLSARLGYGGFPGYERADGTREDNEWRVVVEFWLTAFPEIGARGEQGRAVDQ